MYNYFVEHGSLKLYVDPLFKKGHAKVKSAEVVAIPDLMHGWCKIMPEVNVGDKVYFHYNALREENAIPDQDGCWAIEYQDVFCSVRNGEIIMIGSRILATAIYDKDVVETMIDGVPTKVKMSSFGMITEMHPKHSPAKATLAHIGTPVAGDRAVDINVGDVFYYAPHSDFINLIEGKEYFVMYQEDILAICQD
jgi:co-chaperonin GroES (HSP10)